MMNKKILAKNKKAFFNYEILENFEAGIVLKGSEVKSIKAGHINLQGSYASIKNGEIWLLGAYVSPYKEGEKFDSERPKKLLLKKKEIEYLTNKLQDKGITLIPQEVYLKNGFIKITISLARGKKKYDKREIKKKRELERALRRRYKNIIKI